MNVLDTLILGLTDEILWSILRRGCHNLKSLDLSLSPHFLTDFSVLCIGKQSQKVLYECFYLHFYLIFYHKTRLNIETDEICLNVANCWISSYFFSWDRETKSCVIFLATAKQCKSLEELKISGVEMSTSSLKVLAKGCSNLEVHESEMKSEIVQHILYYCNNYYSQYVCCRYGITICTLIKLFIFHRKLPFRGVIKLVKKRKSFFLWV